MVEYLSRFIGRPYIWAGDGTGPKNMGFDCSGLVLEGLWAFGYYDGQDMTADGIRKWCSKNHDAVPQKWASRGDLLFFGSDGSASHCAVCIGDGLMLEAGGGGRSCLTEATSTGFVRVRPMSRRSDLMAAYRLKSP